MSAPADLTASPTGEQDDLDAWQQWMTAWEVFIDAALTMDPEATTAPEIPDVAIPLSAVPPELAERLARAQALRVQAVAGLRERLARLQARPPATYLRTPDQPAQGASIDL